MAKHFPARVWKLLLSFILAISFTCAPITQSRAQSGEATGGGIGGVIGGALGHVFGKKGDRTVTTLIGAGIGAIIGSRIGKALSKRDKQRMLSATEQTVVTGQPQSWTGERASGRTEIVSSDRRASQMSVPVLKDKVAQLPPLDFINASYVAAKKETILGGPGLDYKSVGSLKKGDVVTVTGKVQDKPWMLVSQNGVGMGFVAEKSLKATTQTVTPSLAAAGPVENRQTKIQRVCRTIKQTVVVNGKEQSEDVTACQTATGWEVV